MPLHTFNKRGSKRKMKTSVARISAVSCCRRTRCCTLFVFGHRPMELLAHVHISVRRDLRWDVLALMTRARFLHFSVISVRLALPTSRAAALLLFSTCRVCRHVVGSR